MHTLTPTVVTSQARFTYLAISAIVRRQHLSVTCKRASSSGGTFHRSDFTNQSYTGIYEPGGPTEGPLRDAYTPPRITPSTLKHHLDAFVVGQDRAKRTLATAVYNHYQRIQELQRREDEEEEHLAQEERRRMARESYSRHPVEGRESELRNGIHVPALTRERVEDEFPGQAQTTVSRKLEGGDAVWEPLHVPRRDGQRHHPQQQQSGSYSPPHQQQPPQPSPQPLYDPTPLTLEKSNILLLGPSGVGKTLMAKTLARVLEVPFSMSDCTPFTQAGYIGEDAEVCIQRLLAASNYDVARAERGIVCLDEIDKIATAKVSHGKDVSGEGVQQALLKIVEGTTVQVVAKAERGSGSGGQGGGGRGGAQQGGGYPPPGGPTNSPLSGGGQQSASAGQKGETYNVKTDNILFICAGAFNGLHKMVLDRISKGSIGFGAPVRASPGSSGQDSHETILEGEDELFEKHLPYYSPPTNPSTGQNPGQGKQVKRTHNTLDLVTPPDLQKYGLIPELIGRLPITCALSSLSISALVQVLTEPRNSLLQQYTHLLALSQIELRFTTPALHSIAATASKMGTGARGLRTVLERVLGDAMFECPGSGTKYVLVTEEVAGRGGGCWYFDKTGKGTLRQIVEEEEERWAEKCRKEEGRWDAEGRARVNREGGVARTFEEYREKVGAAGF